jgi:hypothetical protein
MMHVKTPVKYRKFSKISIIQCLFTVGLSVIDWPDSVAPFLVSILTLHHVLHVSLLRSTFGIVELSSG